MQQAPRCHAHSKRTGAACRAPAVRGWKVCRLHGPRGGGPIDKRNGNYRTGRYTRETLQAVALIRAVARSKVGLGQPRGAPRGPPFEAMEPQFQWDSGTYPHNGRKKWRRLAWQGQDERQSSRTARQHGSMSFSMVRQRILNLFARPISSLSLRSSGARVLRALETYCRGIPPPGGFIGSETPIPVQYHYMRQTRRWRPSE
jgi:hypothetical protein